MAKLYDENGAVVEGAMLPDEVTTKVSEAVTAKETEFNTTKTELEGKLAEKDRALGARANEFAQFRKLTDDAVAKLSDVEKQLYENQLAQQTDREAREVSDKATREANVKSFIRTKAGTDDKLFAKMEEMWAVVGIQANTPEEMEQKAKMIIGAIGSTEPDLIASLGSMNGSAFVPGGNTEGGQKNEDAGFGTTEKGKNFAADLGIVIEPPKKA